MSILRKWAIIVTGLVTTTVVWGIILPSFALWAPQWIHAFGSSHGAVMTANTLNQIGAGLLAPVAGYAVGRITIRNLMLLGALLTAVALVLAAYATAMWQVTMLHMLLLSAGVVLCGPLITQALAVRLFQENRGLAIGIVTAGAPICSFTLPTLIGTLLVHFSWRTVELQMAGLVVLLMPLLFFVVRETPSAEIVETEENIVHPTLGFGEIITHRTFWAILLAVFPLNLLFNAIYFNIGFSLADLGSGPGATATLLVVTGLVSLPGVLVYGALTDRLPHIPLMTATVTVVALCCVVAALAHSYGVLLVDLPIMGFAIGGLMPLVAAILAKRYGTANFAQVNGLITPFVTLATLGSAGAGYARDYFGSYPAAYTAMLLSLPLCAFGLLLLRKKTHLEIPMARAA